MASERTAMRGKGKCPMCEWFFAVRKDGTLRTHGRPACTGSHRRPRRDGLDWLLNHNSVKTDVVEHFWHLEDGEPCECEVNGRV